MVERTRFAARSSTAFPIIGLGALATVTLPLLAGGIWFVGGPLLGIAAILAVVRRPKGTILVIDRQGLLDRRLGVPIVAWRHVESFAPVTVFGVVYININLSPAGAAALAFSPWRKHVVNRACKLLGITPFHVTVSELDATPDEVIASLNVAIANARAEAERPHTPSSPLRAITPRPPAR
jgi:hypothetical protein